jgi:hypothetical protein
MCLKRVEHFACEISENTQRNLPADQIVLGDRCGVSPKPLRRPPGSQVLESESRRACEEEDALVNERGSPRIELVYIAAGLKHMRNGSKFEPKESAGFDLLARPILAGGKDAVEAISKKIHALGRVLMTLNHCATPPFTTQGHATRRTQQNTRASKSCLLKKARAVWKSCAAAVDLGSACGLAMRAARWS